MNPWRAAIDQALLLQKQPGLAMAFRNAALPDGMAVLIRLVSDEGGRRKELANQLGLEENVLQAAAAEYLHTVCLHSGSSGLRALGLNPQPDLGMAKEHHRLLLKWLHPDRNPDNQHLAERVNQAWADLKKQAKSQQQVPVHYEPKPEAIVVPSGRFPLFLWGITGLLVVLLAISMLPDTTVYVADDVPGQIADSAIQQSDASTNGFEKRLSALQLAFGEIGKPAKPTAKDEKKPHVDGEKSAKKKPENNPARIAKKPAVPAETPIAEVPVVAGPAESRAESDVRQVSAKPDVAYIQPPASAASPSKAASETKLDVLGADGAALVAEFRQRYKQGDIRAFMQLFSDSARNNRGDRQAIEADYSRFFSNSSSRKINFSDEQWMFLENVIQYRANYSATVRHKGDLVPQTSKGGLQLVMSVDHGKLRIQQIVLGK